MSETVENPRVDVFTSDDWLFAIFHTELRVDGSLKNNGDRFVELRNLVKKLGFIERSSRHDT